MSKLKTNTLENVAGTKSVPVSTVVDGSAKAWVNFNGTGTVAIRKAFNVSSITDNGAGDYTVNFTNPMPDANYATNVTFGMTGITAVVILGTASLIAAAVGSRRFSSNLTSTGAATDVAELSVSVFN